MTSKIFTNLQCRSVALTAAINRSKAESDLEEKNKEQRAKRKKELKLLIDFSV